jgi:hypothetical protein
VVKNLYGIRLLGIRSAALSSVPGFGATGSLAFSSSGCFRDTRSVGFSNFRLT